jgi:hypothetical protein
MNRRIVLAERPQRTELVVSLDETQGVSA